MTYDERLREEALDRAVEARESHWTHVDTLRHEDGSVTVPEALRPYMNGLAVIPGPAK